jgi:hypothetical protein
MLTAVILNGLEGGVGTYAPIVLAILVTNIDCGESAAEGDIDAILVHISGGAVSKMSDGADVA